MHTGEEFEFQIADELIVRLSRKMKKNEPFIDIRFWRKWNGHRDQFRPVEGLLMQDVIWKEEILPKLNEWLKD